MFRNLRSAAVSLFGAATLLLVPVAVPVMVSADSTSNADISKCLQTGANLSTPSNDATCDGGLPATNPNDRVNGIIKTVINVFSLVVGVVAVIMIIAGGFRYITSGGDSGKIGGAKNTIIYAIIGLVVVALAQIIVQFVLGKVTPTA